jgi:hypothetical protein
MSRTKLTQNSIAAGAINANTMFAADVVGPHSIANTSTYSVGELLVGGTILLDNTGVITGPSSITSTAFVGGLTGNVTGNASGTAATVTTAAQPAITSLGTLTALTVDNLNINTNTISSTSGALNITPTAGSAIVLDGTVNVDAGVITGATSVTSTAFVGALTGNASGTAATVTTAAQPAITSVGTLTSFRSTGIDDNADALAITIDSSERVGIGTASPAQKLDVNGVVQITASAAPTTDSNFRLWSESGVGANIDSWNIKFNTGLGGTRTNIMYLNTAGNVGIGTSSPTDKVHVEGGHIRAARNYMVGSSAGSAIAVNSSGGSQVQFVQSGSDDELAFLTHYSGVSHNEKMRIKRDGKVGIGTSAPATTLHVVGGIEIDHGSAASVLTLDWVAAKSGRILFAEGATTTGAITMHSPTDSENDVLTGNQQDGNMVLGTGSSGAAGEALVLVTNGVERARIDNAGLFGIGQTPTKPFQVYANGGLQFAVHQDIASPNAHFMMEGGTNLAYLHAQGATNTIAAYSTNGTGSHNWYTNGNTQVLRMKLDGTGRFTLPYQPRFLAQRSSNQTNFVGSTQSQAVLYDSAVQNVGNHFNTSTGKFTAPVAGMYAFQASVYSNNTFSQAWLVINGSRPSYGDVSVSATGHAIFAATWIFYLAANDTVGYHPYNASSSNQTIYVNSIHTWFKGYLIS